MLEINLLNLALRVGSGASKSGSSCMSMAFLAEVITHFALCSFAIFSNVAFLLSSTQRSLLVPTKIKEASFLFNRLKSSMSLFIFCLLIPFDKSTQYTAVFTLSLYDLVCASYLSSPDKSHISRPH